MRGTSAPSPPSSRSPTAWRTSPRCARTTSSTRWAGSRNERARAVARDGGLQPLDEREALRLLRAAHRRAEEGGRGRLLQVDPRNAEPPAAGRPPLDGTLPVAAVRREVARPGALLGLRRPARRARQDRCADPGVGAVAHLRDPRLR